MALIINVDTLRRLNLYKPQYLGLMELAQILGVGKQVLYRARRANQVPAPIVELNMGPVWTIEQVRVWCVSKLHHSL